MATQITETDGRKARRDRNRVAVIDAMITLLFEDGTLPATEAVAERAGVSVSSLFRYFDNLEDLQQQTVETYFERFGNLFEIPSLGEGTLDQRIGRFVAARAALHDKVAPVARVTRVQQTTGSPVAERLAATRERFANQVRTHFDAELSGHPAAIAESLADAIDVLTSFEAWDLLHTSHGQSDRQIRRTWTTAVTALLSPS